MQLTNFVEDVVHHRCSEVDKCLEEEGNRYMLLHEIGYGWTVMHYAASRGFEDMCKILMKHAAQSENLHTTLEKQDVDGNTPLHLAIMAHHDGIYDYMVSVLNKGTESCISRTMKNKWGKCAEYYREADQRFPTTMNWAALTDIERAVPYCWQKFDD